MVADKVAALDATAGWVCNGSHTCGEDDSTKLANGVAYLASEMGIYTLLPVTLTESRAEPHFRLTVHKTLLTVPEEEYLPNGANIEPALEALGESYFIVAAFQRQ